MMRIAAALCGILACTSAMAAPPKLVPVHQGGVEVMVPDGWTVQWTDQMVMATTPAVTPETYGFVSVVWVKDTGQYHQMMVDSVGVSYEKMNPVFQGHDDHGGYTVVLRTPSGPNAFLTAIHLQRAGKDELYCTALAAEGAMTVGEVVQFSRAICDTVRTGGGSATSGPPRQVGPAGMDIAGTWAVAARGENPRMGGGTLTLSDRRYVLMLWATDGNVLLHEVGDVKATEDALIFSAEGRGGGSHSFLLLDDGGTLAISGNCPVARACGEADVFRARRVASTAR